MRDSVRLLYLLTYLLPGFSLLSTCNEHVLEGAPLPLTNNKRVSGALRLVTSVAGFNVQVLHISVVAIDRDCLSRSGPKAKHIHKFSERNRRELLSTGAGQV